MLNFLQLLVFLLFRGEVWRWLWEKYGSGRSGMEVVRNEEEEKNFLRPQSQAGESSLVDEVLSS